MSQKLDTSSHKITDFLLNTVWLHPWCHSYQYILWEGLMPALTGQVTWLVTNHGSAAQFEDLHSTAFSAALSRRPVLTSSMCNEAQDKGMVWPKWVTSKGQFVLMDSICAATGSLSPSLRGWQEMAGGAKFDSQNNVPRNSEKVSLLLQ